MAEKIKIGTQVRLKVDYTNNSETDPISEPTVTITDSLDVTSTLGTSTKMSDGVYFYDWISDTVGDFVIHFVGIFAEAGTVITDIRITVQESQEITVTLGEDRFSSFAATLDPLYADPEEVQSYYSEAPFLDVAELIYRFSTEVKNFFIRDEDVPFTAVEYVRAATLCALSKTYDYGVMGDEGNVALGDLSFSSRSFPKLRITRANATSWCELAGALRAEMLRLVAGKPRSFVKASRWENPIPVRKLANKDH